MFKKFLIAFSLIGLLTTGVSAQELTRVIKVSKIQAPGTHGYLRTARTATGDYSFQAWDSDDSVWRTLLSFTSGTSPSISLNGGTVGLKYQTFAAGTVATLPTTTAILDFGTTDPKVTIAVAGIYRITARFKVEATAATITNQTMSFKLRRSNNTAADITGSPTTTDIPVMTTLTHTIGTEVITDIYYTTANTDDVIELWGTLSGSTGAGSITVSEAQITAMKAG